MAPNVAPKALLSAEAEARRQLMGAIDRAGPGAAALQLQLGNALAMVRKQARVAGREALVTEVGKLRPKLDATPLMRLRADRSDLRRARADAKGLSLWWLAFVALEVERGRRRKQAQADATRALRERAEGVLVTSNAEGFGEERIKASVELNRLKEKKS
jgi:hypothetical protein